MRVFIAVELSEEIKKNIAELINELKMIESGVKWVEPQNLHLTLKFLGWIEENKINEVIGLTNEAVQKVKGFAAKFEGLGNFPEGKSPRVFWIGIPEGGKELIRLANSLEEKFSQAGYRTEKREFTPHITVGRIKEKKGVDRLKEKIANFKKTNFGSCFIKQVSIRKSTLTPKGPIYELIKEVAL